MAVEVTYFVKFGPSNLIFDSAVQTKLESVEKKNLYSSESHVACVKFWVVIDRQTPVLSAQSCV